MSDYLRCELLIIGKKSINLPDCVWYYSLMQYFKNNSLHLSNWNETLLHIKSL